MDYPEAIRELEALENQVVRLEVLEPNEGSAPIVSAVGTLARIHPGPIPQELREYVDERAIAFEVGQDVELSIWPHRFIQAVRDALGDLVVHSQDGVIRIAKERPPWV